MATSTPWRTGLSPRSAEPKWKQSPGEVSPRREPTWKPLREEPVPDTKHTTVKYTPVRKGK